VEGNDLRLQKLGRKRFGRSYEEKTGKGRLDKSLKEGAKLEPREKGGLRKAG